MPIAKLPDVRRALVLPVFCRRLPRDAVILLWEYVEGPARFFYNVRPDEEAYDEWKPGMELILKFLGREAWRSFGVTNQVVWSSFEGPGLTLAYLRGPGLMSGSGPGRHKLDANL